ncbi:MAG: leucine-rich repeat domain-containing protein [Lachnospiraceae bacterium]|nr:leucine-rich repeat domain-containing protein [Lachnospiraceae bacterium]
MAKIIRRAIAILLTATAVILLVLPAANVNATYTKGDYVIDAGTLVSYTGQDSDITIPLGISTIGKDAFSGNSNLTRVYIPDEVTSIDYAAFENCKNLQKVEIGEGVKNIGSSAFSGCLSLTDINIPKHTETIGSGSFAACPNLTTINVDPGNRNFICLDGVLYTKDGEKMVQYLAGRPYSTYDIPEPVNEIGEFGFYGANMLTNVSVIDGVEEIPEYAFLNCTALNNVVLPGSIKAIRKGAFGGCSNLTKLNVPTSCGLIDPEAFTSLEGVTGDVVNENTGEVLSESNEQSDNYNTSSESSHSESIDDNSVSTPSETNDNVQPETVSIPSVDATDELASTTIVGGNAVFLLNPKSMKAKGFDINAAQTEDSIADSGNSSASGEDIRSYSGKEFDVVSGNLGHYGSNNSIVNIPEGVNKIGNRVFYNNKNIQSVSIPQSVSEIGDFSFARSSLASIDIPSNVQKIGYAAFYNCNDLSMVNVPSSVKEIELGAFENTAFLNNWKSIEDGNNFLILGDGILVAYKGHSSEVIIPNSVKTIGPGVFEGDTRLKQVSIPGNCKKISEDAFNGCRKLSSISLPDNLEIIEDRAFKDTNINFVELPMTIKEIGLGSFDTYDINGGLDCVVFKGSFLPNLTHKPTATRLSANNLRTNAFNGAEFAIVPSGVNMGSGNIFDPDKYGFRGEVYSAASSDDDENQYLQLRKCTKEPDFDGSVIVDSEVAIGNNTYYLSGVSETVFDAYKNPDWCNNKLTSITLNGNNSAELNRLLADVNLSTSSGSNSDLGTYGDSIRIASPDGSVNPLYCNAVLPNNTNIFNMTIVKNPSLRSDFEKAFDDRFSSHDNLNMETYSIDMTDRLGNIPIKKMANDKLDITIPMPMQFNEAENVQVATLDDNGLLESVSANIGMRGDGTKTISFVASHLSPFAIFTSENLLLKSAGVIESENSIGDLTTVQESVTTLEALSDSNNVVTDNVVFGTLQKEVAPGIPLRYIMAIIMLLVAAGLFLYKNKKIIK